MITKVWFSMLYNFARWDAPQICERFGQVTVSNWYENRNNFNTGMTIWQATRITERVCLLYWYCTCLQVGFAITIITACESWKLTGTEWNLKPVAPGTWTTNLRHWLCQRRFKTRSFRVNGKFDLKFCHLRYVTANRNLHLTWTSSLNLTRKRSARISGWKLEAQNYATGRQPVTVTSETASDAVIIILSSWSDDHSAPSHESWFKVPSAFPPDLILPAGSALIGCQ